MRKFAIAVLLIGGGAFAQTPEDQVELMEAQNQQLIAQRDALQARAGGDAAQRAELEAKYDALMAERTNARAACVDGISVSDLELVQGLAGGTIATGAVATLAGGAAILDQTGVIKGVKDKETTDKDESKGIFGKDGALLGERVKGDGNLKGSTNLNFGASIAGVAAGGGGIAMSAIAGDILKKQREAIQACKDSFSGGY
ncbi:MAG: hypothetical protein LBT92_03855 [Rickettsiales bacterium]|nr:hypothetical protein [Rickettsiales bacterium]